MENIKLFDTITKEEALKFEEDWECGDILAISHLLHSQTKKENSYATVAFLIALAKMNELIVEMEEEKVEWNEKFFDLYKDFTEFLADNCSEKTKENKEDNQMIKTWEEFDKKYKNKLRDFLTIEEEREFVKDYSNCCEVEGFNNVYWSPYTEWEEYYGKPFKVIKRVTEEECDLEVLPAWKIQFEDSTIIHAYPEEIVASEMKKVGCPEKFFKKENKESQEDLNCLYARLMMKLQCELFSYKETLYRMTVDEVMEEAYKLTMLKEFVKVFESKSKETLNAEQFNFYLRMDNALEYLYDVWLGEDTNEREIYADFLFKDWNWEM